MKIGGQRVLISSGPLVSGSATANAGNTMQRPTDPSRVVRVLVVDDDPPLASARSMINLESSG